MNEAQFINKKPKEVVGVGGVYIVCRTDCSSQFESRVLFEVKWFGAIIYKEILTENWNGQTNWELNVQRVDEASQLSTWTSNDFSTHAKNHASAIQSLAFLVNLFHSKNINSFCHKTLFMQLTISLKTHQRPPWHSTIPLGKKRLEDWWN